jgi:hypothetical protein
MVKEEGRVRCLIIGTRNHGERSTGFQFLGRLLFDFMDGKGICKLSQNCSEVPKYFATNHLIVLRRSPQPISA